MLWCRIVVSLYWMNDKMLYKEIKDHPKFTQSTFRSISYSQPESHTQQKKEKLIAKCLEILEFRTCFITVPPRRRPLGSVNYVIIYRKVKNDRKYIAQTHTDFKSLERYFDCSYRPLEIETFNCLPECISL